MPGTHDQLWVTSALSNEDVRNALLLCSSLRQVYTSRKIAVIAELEISLDNRKALHHGFDLVFYLPKDENTTGLDPSEFVKIYSLFALQGFHSCAYLSSKMMALKNVDEIFSQHTKEFHLLEGPTSDTSAFTFTPSRHRFELLVAELRKNKGIGAYQVFKNWAVNCKKQFGILQRKYNIVIEKQNALIRFENEISIVNFESCTHESDISNFERTGLLGKLIACHWRKLQGQVEFWLNTCTVSSPQLEHDQVIRPNYESEPIAIVGMSCRLPSCNNLEEFWELIFQGRDGSSTVPSFRWVKEHCSKYIADARQTNGGFLKDPVDEFDAKFFEISPKEALFMDPQQRLLHELVWESLEDACIDPQTLHGSSGSVFIGSWLNDYKHILEHSGNEEFYRSYKGNSIGAAAARISFLLGLTGPSIATESGCSSAMVAVHLACRSLKTGETNLAFACGVNLLLNPVDHNSLPTMVSPDGRSKSFSEDANGFGRAEGGGVLVLKRLSDALRNGDRIWGLIRGSAMSQEGISNSMGTPTVHCESLAIKQALVDANVDSHQVSYLEAHGSGTVVGDPLEIAAITKAYKSEHRKQPLIIGSVKTNVGHTESCSGITGIIKVLLAMHHETIPAHINFTKLNPSIDLDVIPAVIPLERMPWKRTRGEPRIAGVSSFGITGTDAHVILEETPDRMHSKALTLNDGEIERPLHIIKLSTKSEEAMTLLLEKYKSSAALGVESIADIAFSANTGRADFPIRSVIIAKSNADICTAIEQRKFLKGEANLEKVGKICFLFTGQGSQYPGMAKQLYDTSPIFRMHFEYCEKILREMHNISITNVIWSDEASRNDKHINRTIYSQTSIFCVEYALMRLWESWGVRPDYVLGHSLGEFAAAVCAGILTVEDAIKLVAERSKLIDKLPHGKMLVIRTVKRQVDEAMHNFTDGGRKHNLLDYAAINSNHQTVVAGDSDVVMAFSKHCTESGLKCAVLETSHAFHSRHVDPMLEKYRKVAKAVSKQDGQKCGYISGMTGDIVTIEQMDAEYWVHHTREKVDFLCASNKAVQVGCRTFIEIGPQPVLSALTMMNSKDTNVLCVPSLRRGIDDWPTLLNSLATLYIKGVLIDWSGLDQFHARKKVRLPCHPFIRKRFWPDMTMRKSDTSAQSGNVIHPLLGFPIPNAASIKIFQSEVSLQNCEYLKDHCIGDKVIFPGAAYLEMCLVAGSVILIGSQSDSLTKPNRPVKVENLIIKAPLALEDLKPCQFQTVVESSNGDVWSDMEIKIFHQVGKSNSSAPSWLQHAQAIVSFLLTADEKTNCFLHTGNVDLQKCWKNEPVKNFYEQLESVGLKFGSIFKSLESEWYDENENILFLKLKPLRNQDAAAYICHPIILDAMLQATVRFNQLNDSAKKGLHVPVKIGKFVCFPSGTSKVDTDFTNNLFIQVYHGSRTNEGNITAKCGSGYCTAVLLNYAGNPLASISEIEFVATTVQTIESVLHQQINPMPDLWEEVWRKQDIAPSQHRARLDLCQNAIDSIKCSPLEKHLQSFNSDCTHIIQTFDQLNHFACISSLSAMYECGWEPLLSQIFDENELIHQLGINMEFKKQVNYFLNIFQEEGWLQQVGGNTDTWRVMQVLPSQSQAQIEKSRLYPKVIAQQFQSAPLILKIDRNLSNILKGSESVLPILFPVGEGTQNEPSVATVYAEFPKFVNFNCIFVQRNRAWLEEYKKQTSIQFPNERFVLRILEVGAGTGGYTILLLELLEELDIEYEYTFTDISTSFFSAAERKFDKFAKHMKFKRLDIEMDPISQGFVPGYYDMIYAFDVVHATKVLAETLENVRTLLKSNGYFDIWEATRVCRFTTYMFGLLDGFWRFQDFHIRSKHCTISKSCWVEVLQQSGFCVIGEYPCANHHKTYICCVKNENHKQRVFTELSNSGNKKTWLVFHQENEQVADGIFKKFRQLCPSRTVISIKRSSSGGGNLENGSFTICPECEDDFIPLMEILNNEKWDVEGILYCWSLDKTFTKQQDILRPYFFLVKSLEQLKSKIKLVTLLQGNVPFASVDFPGVCTSSLVGFTKSLANEKSELRCKCIDVGLQAAMDPDATLAIFYELWANDTQVAFHENSRYVPKLIPLHQDSATLEIPSATDRFQLVLSDTNSIGDLEFGPLDPVKLEPEQIEVQVKAYALNFRDVMSVLKPSDEFKDLNSVGLDFSGVVMRVGSQVTMWSVGDFVFGMHREQGNIFQSHIIKHESDVVAVPKDLTFSEAATLPAVFITNHESLIEFAKLTASDSVLIHAASGGVGLNAIDICKRVGATIFATAGSTRKQNYLRSLGIQHVFHSRNTEYEREILTRTNGRGIDVVLNSLTSEGFKEATLRVCAKGARFIELGKMSIWQPQQVRELRPDVKYTIVDESTVTKMKCRLVQNTLTEQLLNSDINPLPYIRFDGVNIQDAMYYMQKAKHIGKVVCVMPEFRNENGKREIRTPLFHANATYLITGGLGGIGMELCKWMVRLGARYVLLAGRNSPTSNACNTIIAINKEYTSRVEYVPLDVSSFDQCQHLIKCKISEMGYPILRGVMHVAGSIWDSLVENQTWKDFSKPFAAKIDGTINLHQFTKNNSKMEHFVLFSSVATCFGSPGQSNHSAACHFEDMFAHYRHSIGLPATTVNWGQWGEVGVANQINVPGFKPMSTLQALAGLEYALKSQRVQTAVVNIESFTGLKKRCPNILSYLDEIAFKSIPNDNITSIAESNKTLDEFMQQYKSLNSSTEKQEMFKCKIRSILRQILKLDNCDSIEDNMDFEKMGVDSLMFVEISNSLKSFFADRVPLSASTIRESNSVALLSENLVQLIDENEDMPTAHAPTLTEVNALIREDCALPEYIGAKAKQNATPINRASCVLVTGCTGTLGPYILKELSSETRITAIFCLIRPGSKISGIDRLQSVLRERHLLTSIDMSKIQCVDGNVALPCLGLKSTVWENLIERVDAVVHCAASVQHLERYSKRNPSAESMRMVNIQGTKNVLEFCCSGTKLKHVFHASSLVAVAKIEADGHLAEDWPQPDDYNDVTTYAYPITKFVGDVLMKQAILERGIPGKVFRFPMISGDSKTGRFVLDSNHIMHRFLFILKHGIMQENPFPIPMVPVDICARAAIQLFFNPNVPNDSYNVIDCPPLIEQEFQGIAKKLRYNIDIVEYSKFVQTIHKSTVEDSPFAMFKELYKADNFLETFGNIAWLPYWMSLEDAQKKCFMESRKISKYLPEFYCPQISAADRLFRDMLFAKAHGWITKHTL